MRYVVSIVSVFTIRVIYWSTRVSSHHAGAMPDCSIDDRHEALSPPETTNGERHHNFSVRGRDVALG
jgi:hypothetical protein